MNILRSRSEQLADHLRGCLERRELSEPLPGVRAWAAHLGVSPTTLKTALAILKTEGLLRVEPRRRVRLGTTDKPARQRDAGPRLVRLVYYGAETPDRPVFVFLPALMEKLFEREIHLQLHRCTLADLQALSRDDPDRRELLLLLSIPAEYQARFVPLRHRALLLGHPAAGSPLSFVAADTDGAVRHAALSLLRQGVTDIGLLLPRSRSAGDRAARSVFEETCRQWPRAPVRTEFVAVEMDPEQMTETVWRFAARVRSGQGILVLDIPVSLVMTALLERGPSPARAVALRALMTRPDWMQVCRRPPCYPFPAEALARRVARAAARYFACGLVPRLRVTLPVEAVPAAEPAGDSRLLG